jgi:hypothetical protein
VNGEPLRSAFVTSFPHSFSGRRKGQTGQPVRRMCKADMTGAATDVRFQEDCVEKVLFADD